MCYDTYKVSESCFAGRCDFFEKLQGIEGPAVNDVDTYCTVHVVL